MDKSVATAASSPQAASRPRSALPLRRRHAGVHDPTARVAAPNARCSVLVVKIGIVVPFSWSFWGAVVEHAELQAAALAERGHDVRLIIGNDPPGQFTRVLHPRVGRHDDPPPNVIPVGRSVIVPANGSLPNIVLSPRAFFRIRRALERERFDVLHLHEPMTPAICTATLVLARTPLVATFHASGNLGWMRFGTPLWGFLVDRIDHRIAVSEQARASQVVWLPGEYEVVPNGVLLPEAAPAGNREHRIVFAGRHGPRKGLHVLLGAWPEIRARTGLRLTVAGADPLAVRLLLARLRVPDDGVDVVGFLSQETLTSTLLGAKALVAPSLGQESFGMVLTRAFACALPAVASDIPGYREVLQPEAAIAVPPDDRSALVEAVAALVGDEPRRAAMGEAARVLATERYSWQTIASRLEQIYEQVTGLRASEARAA
jgi:phosphatidyl-myo-inositol alpha-mannosyltransferase